jgi:uncharacterized ferritin-like protein (DUF455 family)
MGTVERWCLELIEAVELAAKLAPPPPPDTSDDASWEPGPPARRPAGPGRPPELRVSARSPRTPGDLARPEARAALLHRFAHHELQAAELFAWAVLAFPDAPREFRAGLVRLAGEELAHLGLYVRQLERLGARYGDLEVRDWFWERVATCEDAASFVALQGLGLEGANLDHSVRFVARFQQVGDDEGARILGRVERDEERHVAFAAEWFPILSGEPLDFDRWSAALPAPLTPALLRGLPLNRAARRAAGQEDAFLDRLEAQPSTTASRTAR